MTNKIKNIFKNNWQLIFLGIGFVLVSLPNFKIYWMLVDDGYDVWFSRTLLEKFLNINIFGIVSQLLEIGGRFRPIYWFYHSFVYLFGGTNYLVHRFFHIMIFGLIILLIYKIVSKFTNNKNAGLLSSLIFMLTPTNFENWARLGPQEPLLTLFLLLFLYFFQSFTKKSSLFIFLAIFTKEISIFIVPAIFYLYIFRKQVSDKVEDEKFIARTMKLSAIAIALLITITLMIRRGYSSNYLFDVKGLLSNIGYYLNLFFISYSPLLTVALASYLYRFLVKCKNVKSFFKDKGNILETLFFILPFSYILAQSPWRYPIERYLFPALSFFAIFIGIELYNLYGLVSNKIRKNYLLKFAVIFLSFCWVAMSTYRLVSYTYRYAAESSFKPISIYIKDNVPPDSTIYVNLVDTENTKEYIDEMGIHMQEFFNRNDISFKFIDTEVPPNGYYAIVSVNNLPRKYSEKELSDKGMKITKFKSQRNILVFTTPLNIVKQFVKKIPEVIKTGKIDYDGIYTFYRVATEWNIYEKTNQKER